MQKESFIKWIIFSELMNKNLSKIKEKISKNIDKYFFPIIGIAAVVLFARDTLLPYISSKFQVPIPIMVSAEDYGVYANENQKKLGIIMNTEPRLEINQNSGLEIKLIDGDGFYPNKSWSNPHLEIYGTSPAGFPRKMAVRTTFLSKPTNEVNYLDIQLPPGDYVLGIFYHETSGLFRRIAKNLKIN